MPKGILMDEIHLAITVAWRLPARDQMAVCKAIRSRRFQKLLRVAVGRVAKQFPSLRHARFSLSR